MPDHRSDPSGPPSLSLALHSVLDAAVDASARTGLLTLVRSAGERLDTSTGDHSGQRTVVPFPSPRRPTDDGPHAA